MVMAWLTTTSYSLNLTIRLNKEISSGAMHKHWSTISRVSDISALTTLFV